MFFIYFAYNLTLKFQPHYFSSVFLFHSKDLGGHREVSFACSINSLHVHHFSFYQELPVSSLFVFAVPIIILFH